MNKTISMLVLATISLASLTVLVPAAATSDTGVCTDNLTVIGGPGAGEVGLWTNDCIVVAATNVVITFTTIDGLPHRPVAKDCFDLANIGAGASKTVSLRLAGAGVLNGLSGCSLSAVEDRDGTFIPSSRSEPGPVIVANADGSKTIHYICGIHGPAMHGTITLGA